MKQAKEEAQAEIDGYRKQREDQYQKYEKSILGSRSDMESQIDQETKKKLIEVDSNVRKNKDGAIKNLLDFVVDIQPELHKNYVEY